MKSLTVFIIFSILIILIYSIFEFYCSIKYGVNHPELTACIFGFFGTELAGCTLIKIFKIKEEENYD